jgi:hypothetical protein
MGKYDTYSTMISFCQCLMYDRITTLSPVRRGDECCKRVGVGVQVQAFVGISSEPCSEIISSNYMDFLVTSL